MKKRVMIGIIVIFILLVIGSYFIYDKLNTNRKVKKANIGTLKFFKCLTDCPAEEVIYISNTEEGKKAWKPQENCLSACDNAYLESLGEEIKELKLDEEGLIVEDSARCRDSLFFDHPNFESCVNDLLKKYSRIIDLSNVDVSVDY